MYSRIAVAVAATLTAGTALAAYDPITGPAPDLSIVVAGSSAFKTAFVNELNNNVCDSNGKTTFSASGSLGFFAYACTTKTGGAVPAALSGKNTVFYLRTEGGSGNGVFPFAFSPNKQIKRLSLDSGCTGGPPSYTCAVSSYTFAGDVAGANSSLVADFVDVGISDTEPAAFRGENVPDTSNSPYPTSTESYSLGATRMSTQPFAAQIFGVAVGTGSANSTSDTAIDAYFTSGAASLSDTTITGILSGNIPVWSRVPKPDNSGAVTATNKQIVVCRRDVGSGTQVGASITFDGAGCGTSARTFKSSNVLVNNATQGVLDCIDYASSSNQADANAIKTNRVGILGANATLSHANWVKVNGVAPNGFAAQADAAIGNYKYWTVSTYQYSTTPGNAFTADEKTLVDGIFGNIEKVATLSGLASNLMGVPGLSGNPAKTVKVTAPATNADPAVVFLTNAGATSSSPNDTCKPYAN